MSRKWASSPGFWMRNVASPIGTPAARASDRFVITAQVLEIAVDQGGAKREGGVELIQRATKYGKLRRGVESLRTQ